MLKYNVLSFDLPGTRIGPLFPPRCNPSQLSRFNEPMVAVAE